VTRLCLLLLFAACSVAAPPDAAKTVRTISERYKTAREYSFEGELSLAGQRGKAPGRVLSAAKVKIAAAPSGKFYLRIEPVGKDAYVLMSNGLKSWAFVPRLKQYTEEEAAFREDQEGSDEGPSDSERDLAETFTRMVLPVLAKLDANVQAADFHGEVPVKFEKRKVSWPLLRVMTRPAQDQSVTLTQLGVDPDTLSIGRMIYSTVMREGDDKTVIQMTLDFSTFQLGPLDDSTFEFVPPKGARLVETLPIPGQTGSVLLNRPAPDFELKTLDGEKLRLSDLRGRPVLLSFWASWCGPCRHELPGLSALNQQFKEKGLVILGINDEGKGTARKYSDKAGLNFETLDDSGSKVYRLYRVYNIPTLFLIDKSGKISVFMKGSREPEKIRAALAAVGL
jgi:peroxiredoxin/outer membrane lipoprotein-sorting protein